MKRSLKDFSRKKQMYGRMFILPWMIGFVLFFMIPLFTSLFFCFNKVSVGPGGFTLTWSGFDNFYNVLFEHGSYSTQLFPTLGSFIYTIPLVVALSLIVAVFLNQKFKGRIVFRSIFFLPVIVATGVVMQYIQGDAAAEALRSGGAGAAAASNGVDVTAILEGMHLSEELTTNLVTFVNDIFDLFWACGVQIVLFISGLQSIPESLYEVCRVEGANKWEEFWYVTFPMLSGSTILVIIFTAIESFTDSKNQIMTLAYNTLSKQIYDDSAAMLWLYFALVGLILGLAILLLQKLVFSKWATE